jgi:hypothetical protein
MRQRLLVLVDEKAPGISDVGASRGGVFLRSGAQGIVIGKRKSFSTLQLRRHISIGRIHYETERTRAQWMIFDARFDVAFNKGT